MKNTNYRALYQAETAKLRAIADSLLYGTHHLCENILEFPPEIQEPVFKILRRQLELLILINRETPLPFIKGK